MVILCLPDGVFLGDEHPVVYCVPCPDHYRLHRLGDLALHKEGG